MTAHNEAKKGDFAKTVLMPGDPLRAKFIAENYLQNVVLVNSVRGMLGYTGTYKNKPISIMGHGMGIPSIGIYSYELFKFYDVENIIRIGSCGSYTSEINLGDVVLVDECYSNSSYPVELGIETKDNITYATKELCEKTIEMAKKLNIKIISCRAHATDCFYNKYSLEENIKRSNAKVVEMEAPALYANAIKLNKKGLVLLTVSDSLITKQEMTPKERQKSFDTMIKLALETAISL